MVAGCRFWGRPFVGSPRDWDCPWSAAWDLAGAKIVAFVAGAVAANRQYRPADCRDQLVRYQVCWPAVRFSDNSATNIVTFILCFAHMCESRRKFYNSEKKFYRSVSRINLNGTCPNNTKSHSNIIYSRVWRFVNSMRKGLLYLNVGWSNLGLNLWPRSIPWKRCGSRGVEKVRLSTWIVGRKEGKPAIRQWWP